MARMWLRDGQFERIEALLPGKASDPGRTAADNRLFVEAVLWIARTGTPWRDLPPEFGPWNSVYQRFARWSRKGVWHLVFEHLAADADFEEVFIDSTIVRAHQHAAGAPKKRRPSARPTARRTEHQDSLPRPAARVARPLRSDRQPSRRQPPSTAPAAGLAAQFGQRRQGLRHRRHPRTPGGPPDRGGDPASQPSPGSALLRSASVQKPQPRRAFLLPHQAVPAHWHALRQARRTLRCPHR